jgi:hypothetical protein
MTAVVRTISGNRRTGTVLLAAFIVILAGLSLFGSLGRAQPANLVDQTSATFGIGRDTVFVTPKAEVATSLAVPAGVPQSDVTWRLIAGDATTTGTGADVAFTAPTSGRVVLFAEAHVDARVIRVRTAFKVVGAGRMVGTKVETRGTVLVDGGRAVQGEALRAGTEVDARHGVIAYVARATASGSITGKLEFSGSKFVVSAEQVGASRRLNTITVSKDPTGAPATLHAKIQHQDGVRYVKVASPDAVAMVKGTTFDVIVDGDGTDIAVEDGLLGVYDPTRPFAVPEDVATGESVGADRVDVVAGQLDRTALGDANPDDLYGDYAPSVENFDATQTRQSVFEPLDPSEFERMRQEHPDAMDELLGDWYLQAPQQFGDMFDQWANEHPNTVKDVMRDWQRDPVDGGLKPPPPPTSGTTPVQCQTCPPPCSTCGTYQPPSTCTTCSPCTTCSTTSPPPTCTTCNTYTPPPTNCTTCNTTQPCSTCGTYTPPPPPTDCTTCGTYKPPPTDCTTCNTTQPCSTCGTYTPPPTDCTTCSTTQPPPNNTCSTCTYQPPPTTTCTTCSTTSGQTVPSGTTEPKPAPLPIKAADLKPLPTE